MSEKKVKVWPGRPYPLGATWDGKGINFSIFSGHATKAELCLFDSPESPKEAHRIPLVDPRFDWRGDRSPQIPWHRTLIYELHVKGFGRVFHCQAIEAWYQAVYSGMVPRLKQKTGLLSKGVIIAERD